MFTPLGPSPLERLMPSVRTILAAILLAVASLSPISAQDQEVVRSESTPINVGDIDFSASYSAAPKTSLVDTLTMLHYAAGELIVDYRGFQGALVSRILSYHRRVFNQSLDAYDVGVGLSPAERAFIEQAYCYGVTDSWIGCWWNRSFSESLVIERGGAGTPMRMTVGEERATVELGGVSLMNTGRLEWGETNVYLQRAVIDEHFAKAVVSGIVHRHQWRPMDNMEFSIRPRINIKASLKPAEIFSAISVEASLKAFDRRQLIGYISIGCEYTPNDRVTRAKLNIVLFVW